MYVYSVQEDCRGCCLGFGWKKNNKNLCEDKVGVFCMSDTKVTFFIIANKYLQDNLLIKVC